MLTLLKQPRQVFLRRNFLKDISTVVLHRCSHDGIGSWSSAFATGKVPFASSFAMFAAGRAFEQIRNSIGYPHLNVKIGATHAGISVGEDGATHQCNEDIALMRTIPGMVVINPSDDIKQELL